MQELMMTNVQLILFFDVFNIVKASKLYKTDVEASMDQFEPRQSEAKATEQEVQTDLHPIPYHKDESYVWNLWDFRRKAIQLVSSIDLRSNESQLVVSGKSSRQENFFVSNCALVPQTRRCQPATRKPTERTANRQQQGNEHRMNSNKSTKSSTRKLFFTFSFSRHEFFIESVCFR
jgi:hypothetical protein